MGNVCACSKRTGEEEDLNFERTSVTSKELNKCRIVIGNLSDIPEYSVIIDENIFHIDKINLIQKSFRKFLTIRDIKRASQDMVINEENVSLSSTRSTYDKKEIFNSSFISENNENEMDHNLKHIFRQMKREYKILTNILESSLQNKNGFCKLEWKDESYLKGKYRDNKLHGIAKLRINYGPSLIGEFRQNQVDGYAILTNLMGTTYEGTWVKNQLNGICIEKWRDGTFFQGQYKHSRRNGVGTYRLPDGTLYEGNFLNDSLCGWGVMHFSNSNQYSGEWKDDKMHGYGEYLWEDGRLYIGLWEEDRKNGFGMIYWPSPEKAFMGFWLNNKQHGVGCVITQKTLRYGLWQNGDRVKWIHDYEEAMANLGLFQFEYVNIFPKRLEKAKNILRQLR